MAQLCPVAHTKPIRPPVSYTDALKRVQMRAYGDTASPAAFEEDHLLPLSLVEHHVTRRISGRSRIRRRMKKPPWTAPRTTPSAPGRSRCRMRSIGSPPTDTS
jgi:hypothetical protein